MKKTVNFEFSDDFKFPEFWDSRACGFCPFNTTMDDEPLCFLTGDDKSCYKYDIKKSSFVKAERPKCPFSSGTDTVNYEDCQHS